MPTSRARARVAHNLLPVVHFIGKLRARPGYDEPYVRRLSLVPGEMSNSQVSTTEQVEALSEAEVEAIAEAEGLTLLRAPEAKYGFRGVAKDQDPSKARPYMAEIPGKPLNIGNKKLKQLGRFASAPAAALAIARTLGPAGSAERAKEKRNRAGHLVASQELTPDEALRAAQDEELELMVGADGCYAGVKLVPSVLAPRYKATLGLGGESTAAGRMYIGTYATPEEAALELARHRRIRGDADLDRREREWVSSRRAVSSPRQPLGTPGSASVPTRASNARKRKASAEPVAEATASTFVTALPVASDDEDAQEVTVVQSEVVEHVVHAA